jgi:hypothetical protein
MEGFIHDSGSGHEGESYTGAESLHTGGIHAGDVHAGGFDAAVHGGLSAEQSLGSISPANQIGNPNEYEHYWFFQEHNGYCVPSSITQVIEAQSGHVMQSYNTVVQEAHNLGIPVGANGMTLPQAQEILNHFDIPSHIETPATPQQAIDQLANYLHEGRSVVLSVNASPIWYGSDTQDNPTGQADHALVVTAINAQTGEVTLSDPGSPTGNEEQVPLNVFMDAWGASHDQMLVSDHAAGTQDSQVWSTTQHVAGTVDNGLEKAGFVILPIALGVALWNVARKH